MEIRLPFRYLLVIKLVKLPTLATVGVTNRTEDGYFVVFLDYDEVERKVVEEDIDFLQKNYDLGSCLLLESSVDYTKETTDVGNYHVIFFTKHKFPEVREIINLTRCDEHFKRGWMYQGRCWVLRIADKINGKKEVVKPKPKLLKVEEASTNKEASSAFITFFEKLYKTKLHHLFSKVDNTTKVELIDYVTR